MTCYRLVVSITPHPRRYTYTAPPDLETSKPRNLETSKPRNLETSKPPYLYIATRTAHLHTCIPPRPSACSAPLELQSSKHRYLYCLHACNAPPELHTSTSLHLQRASRAPRIHASIPPCRYTCSAHLELHASVSLRFQRASRPSYRHACSASPELISLHLHRAPDLQPSIPHIATPGSRIQTSIPPHVHALTPASRL